MEQQDVTMTELHRSEMLGVESIGSISGSGESQKGPSILRNRTFCAESGQIPCAPCAVYRAGAYGLEVSSSVQLWGVAREIILGPLVVGPRDVFIQNTRVDVPLARYS